MTGAPEGRWQACSSNRTWSQSQQGHTAKQPDKPGRSMHRHADILHCRLRWVSEKGKRQVHTFWDLSAPGDGAIASGGVANEAGGRSRTDARKLDGSVERSACKIFVMGCLLTPAVNTSPCDLSEQS